MDKKGPPPVVVIQPAESESVIVVQQPIAGGAPQLREWNTGVFDCCSDCGSCLFGCFCMHCMMCTVSSRLGEHCLAGHCGGVVALRTKLRIINGIEGGVLSDGCWTAFCGPCIVCQMDREIKHIGY